MGNGYLAFYDSGAGGLSTLFSARRLMPAEDYVYLGDSEHAPYGNRTDAEIYDLARANVDYLLSRYPVKALVLACNTVTTVCISALRREFPSVRIFGVEPAVKPALEAGGKTLLLGTAATVRSAHLRALIRGGAVDLYAPTRLAEAVERADDLGSIDLAAHLPAADGYRNIVLGCTHYVLLRDRLAAYYPAARLFDGNDGTARNIFRTLFPSRPLPVESPSVCPSEQVVIDNCTENIGTGAHRTIGGNVRQFGELMFEKDANFCLRGRFEALFGKIF